MNNFTHVVCSSDYDTNMWSELFKIYLFKAFVSLDSSDKFAIYLKI